jgi:nucleoside 2-deoxyribosyltransferase
VVIDDVKAAIAKADLVIADLSGQNPNVFYEVGIAHTLGKPVSASFAVNRGRAFRSPPPPRASL